MCARILIVDDSPTSVHIFKKTLENEQHDVFISYDGLNIDKIIKDNDIDIVLLDVVMPNVNGFDILQLLQSTEQTKDIPVIMITSLTSGEHVKKALDYGALDYIRKPFEPIELIARVNSALRLMSKQSQLLETSKKDALTTLYNRRFFNTSIEQLISNKNNHQNGIALSMIDCDHFKRINDTFGHTSGDEVLVSVSDVLKKSIRSSDFAYRYGGEEFCLIFPNTTFLQAYAIVERIRIFIENIPFTFDNQSVTITVSCGISHTVLRDSKSSQTLLNEADAALYEAKRNGRNRIECFGNIV